MTTIAVGNTTMPAVGLGIWKIDREATAQAVQDAISIGYRHIDSACDYGNEVEAGEGIKAAIAGGHCSRDDLWVTSKLWGTYHRPERVRAACERSLSDLGLDYLDLYLIHFPIALRYVDFEERYPPGWIYDPDAGKRYKSRLKLRDDDSLEVRGYIGTPMLGRTQIWTRSSAVEAAR